MDFSEGCEALLSKRYRIAITMPDNPHAWTAKDSWDSPEYFMEVVKFIRSHAVTETFRRHKYQVFYLNGWKYWTMGAPVKETTIINRAIVSYNSEYDKCALEYRKKFRKGAWVEENQEVVQN